MPSQKLLARRSVLVSVFFPAQKFRGPVCSCAHLRHAESCCVSPLWFRLCAPSAEPRRLGSRFPPFFLQLVHFFLEVRFFSLQCLYLAIPILNVRNVVFHSRGHVKSTGPVLLYVVLQFRNLLFGCGYLIQQHTGFPAPICLVPSGLRHHARLRFSSGLLRPCRAAARWFFIPHDGDAIAAHSGQIFFGIYLFRRGFFLLRFLRRVSPSFAFLRFRLRLCLRRRLLRRLRSILLRLAKSSCRQPQYGQKGPENLFAQPIALFHGNLTRENTILNATPASQDGQAESISCNIKSACTSQLFPAVGCPRYTPFDTVPDCSASNDIHP